MKQFLYGTPVVLPECRSLDCRGCPFFPKPIVALMMMDEYGGGCDGELVMVMVNKESAVTRISMTRISMVFSA